MKRLLFLFALLPALAFAGNATFDNYILNPSTGGSIQRNSASADKEILVENTDATYKANLRVEGIYKAGSGQISLTDPTGNLLAAAITGTLGVDHGGTGATTAGDARTNLGLVIGTDVQAYSLKLKNFADLSNGAGVLTNAGDGTLTWQAAGGGGIGTVTSVGISAPTAVFDVTNSPVTGAGTLTLSFDNQTANYAFMGPTTGSPAAPAFRALVAADIPSLAASIITSGTLAVANGGTNIASYAVGDLIYASGTTTLAKLADVATGSVLLSGGVNTAPAWGVLTDALVPNDLTIASTSQATFTNATYPPVRQTRTTSGTSAALGSFALQASSSGTPADGFGPLVIFEINSGNSLGGIGAVRAGADNTGAIVFRPTAAGTQVEAARITTTAFTIPSTTATTFNGGVTFAKANIYSNTALSYNATQTWDSTNSRDHSVTLGSGATVTIQADSASSPTNRQLVLFEITQHASSASTVDWSTSSKGFQFTAEQLAADLDEVSSTVGSVNLFGFRYNSTLAKWLCVGVERFNP